MTEEIIWKDPPLAGSKGIWVEILQPLVERPNQWAMVRITKTHNTASYLKRGTLKSPPGKWEFRSHALKDGNVEIYARYLGPTEEGE